MRVFAITLMLLSLAVVAPDAHGQSIADPVKAAAIVRQAAALAGSAHGDPAKLAERRLDRKQEATRQALLANIAELEARLERGDSALTGATWMELNDARHALESIPMTLSSVPKALQNVTGTVTRASDGTPLQGVSVQAIDTAWGIPISNSGSMVTSAVTNASGNFTLVLPPATYVLRARSGPGVTPAAPGGYRNMAYSGLRCDNNFDCQVPFGNVVTVAAAPIAGLNFALQSGSAISGNVTRASDGAPLTGAQINVVGERDGITGFALTDAAGNYTVAGLPAGRYRVIASEGGTTPTLASELYNNKPCSAFRDCRVLPPDWVTATIGTTTSGINLALDTLGSISGILQDDLGNPVANMGITAYSADRFGMIDAVTDASGAFVVRNLRPGTYRLFSDTAPTPTAPLFAQQPTSHVAGAWPAVSCAVGCNPLEDGNPVVVAAAAVVLPSPFVIQRGRQLQVTVLGPGAVPVVGAVIQVGSATASGGGFCPATDAAGQCTVGGLTPGSYFVSADARAQNFLLTGIGGATCATTFCSGLGTAITVPASGPVTTTTINPTLGGTINGTILDAATGVAATNNRARLELFNTTGQLVQQPFQRCVGTPTATTPTTCSFSAAGLPPGTYKGIFASSSNVGWIDIATNGSPCPRGACDQTAIPPLFASTGTILTVNGTLNRGAVISGRVTDAASAGPPDFRAFDVVSSFGLAGGIGFNSSLDDYAAFAQTDRAGFYSTRTGFAPGTTVFASTFLLRNNIPFGWGYVDEAYNNLACPFGSCGVATGTGITVGATDVTGIDFSLDKGGAIRGTVTATAGGAPIPGVQVSVFTGAGRLAGRANTLQNGNYLVQGLSPGTYFVVTANNAGFLDESYNNIPCEPFCNPVDGTSVTVTGTATTTAINFALDSAASIGGSVRLSGAPQANVAVELYGAVGNLIRTQLSTATGGYVFAGLSAGRYFVRTRDTAGRADVLHANLPCVGGACVVRNGTPIDLAAGANATAIDLAITPPATLSGTITRVPGSTPMSGVSVQLLAPSGAVALTTSTNGSGAFSFTGLSPASYRMVTRNTPGVVDVAWPAAPCPAACNGLNGSAIAVAAGASVAGQNFTLNAGGSVSGTVRSGPSTPITGVTMQVYSATGVPVGQILSNASGNYEFNTLPAGNFFVRTQQSLGFADQLFNNLPCTGYCDITGGTPIPVAAGVGTGLVDFTLGGGVSISGTVRDAGTSAGIALARVVAFDLGGFIAGTAQADASGAYTIAGLRPGSYRLRTANLSGYVNRVFGGAACSPAPCPLSGGTTLTLASTALSGINFSLARGGTISGTATDTFNNPLPTGTAILYSAAGAELASNAVVGGLWEFGGLANGTYYVLIRNTVGLIDRLYDNIDCPGGACAISSGTPIVVSGADIPGSATAGGKGSGNAGINVRLPPGQTISGTVRDAATTQPLNGVTVFFFSAAGVEVGQATTNALGQYVSDGGLSPGSYRAATANGVLRGAAGGYVNALYSGQNCLLACSPAGGTPIAVTSAPTTGIDFNLATAGDGITGTVRDLSNNPLALITIRVFTSAGVLAGTAQTNSAGFYRINGLPAGTYFARTANEFGFDDRLFGGAACGTVCNPLLGTPIAVPASGEAANINFALNQADPLFTNGFEAN